MDYTVTLTDEQVAVVKIYQTLIGPLPLIGGAKEIVSVDQWINRTIQEILIPMTNVVNAENDKVMLTTVKEDVDILATVQTKIADIKSAKEAAIAAAEAAAQEAADKAAAEEAARIAAEEARIAAEEARIAAELAAIEAAKGGGELKPPGEIIPPAEEPPVGG